MKTKLITAFVAVSAAFTMSASAVTVSLVGVAIEGAGFITLDSEVVSGRAIFVSTTGSSVTTNASSLSSLLSAPLTSAGFDSALASIIGSTSAGSPGIVRTVLFTNGVLITNEAQEMGDVGNMTHMFLVSENAGNVTGIGAYTGSAVPALGAVVFSPANAGDSIGVGTSVSGFQLAAVVPEPSVALLGAFGVLGLLRRRR